ncbi:LacI family DNA-binding transcriptional regulator [Alkalicoccus chagannorensis]|uniref:LacI family DNA-binding transcriptional regulator n=1 Tax=Alkalicoccus chagannorensis TaxID=427072 RepID=UPI0003FD5208|nr:LacI family DNA-binding transcriptional regulator [Alkalicoccus chagannorensis]
MKLTIKEIAGLAGVSQSTVSKIINNYTDVGPTTKAKVLRVIEEHSYRPTYAAQSLAKKATKVIGVIYAGEINANFNHPFFVEVVNAFKKNIGAEGYDLLFFSNEKFHKKDENYLERCQHYNVDGCFIIGGEKVEPSVYDLDQSSIPCVGIDIVLTGPRSAHLMTDNEQVASQAAEHFYLLGRRSTGFIGGQPHSTISNERKEAFLHTARVYGMKVMDEWILEGDFFEASGYHSMKRLLEQPVLPEAVFAASDAMALGAMRAMRDAGLAPAEIAVIGCDDIPAARFVDPPLTTLRQDKEKIGKMAAFMLEDLIHDRIQGSGVKIDPQLIIRSSCGTKPPSPAGEEPVL